MAVPGCLDELLVELNALARARARTAHTQRCVRLNNELLMVAGNEEWPDSLHTLYISPCNGVLVDYPFGVPLAFDSFISFKLLSGAIRAGPARSPLLLHRIFLFGLPSLCAPTLILFGLFLCPFRSLFLFLHVIHSFLLCYFSTSISG